jgi:hypothetical protein
VNWYRVTFLIFLKSNISLKGSRFESPKGIQIIVTKVDLIKGISENDFQDCSQAWQKRLNGCMKSEGE